MSYAFRNEGHLQLMFILSIFKILSSNKRKCIIQPFYRNLCYFTIPHVFLIFFVLDLEIKNNIFIKRINFKILKTLPSSNIFGLCTYRFVIWTKIMVFSNPIPYKQFTLFLCNKSGCMDVVTLELFMQGENWQAIPSMIFTL